MENNAACAAADILVLTVPFEGQATLLKATQTCDSLGQYSD